MRRSTSVLWAVLATLVLVYGPVSGQEKEPPAKKPLTVEEVIPVLRSEGSTALQRAADRGEELFPAFEVILDDPAKGHRAVGRVFIILGMMKVDRSRFLEPTLRRMADPTGSIRCDAVEFLACVGSEKDTGPVAILLLDESVEVRVAAAETLAKIGSKRDVQVFDMILANADNYITKDGKPLLPKFDREKYEQRRDELKARLKKQEKEKPAAKDEPKK